MARRTRRVSSGPRLPGEFDLIHRYFAPLAAKMEGAQGLTDDACTYLPRPGQELVLTADALVAGIHFLQGDPPDLIARKMLRVNLSDLAAKGATPVGYLMTTGLSDDVDEAWVAKFAAGLAADQETYGIALMGGDTIAQPGPLTLSLTAIGTIAAGTAMRRRGAVAGDRILVSGTLGDGHLGLKVLRGGLADLDRDLARHLERRYHLPEPRVGLGRALASSRLVHAAMDVSDELVGDLGHICTASACGAVVRADRVPLSAAAAAAVAEDLDLLQGILTGGDDYELLFTAPAEAIRAIADMAAAAGVPVADIGEVVAGAGVRVLDRDGGEIGVGPGGYRHF